MTLEILRYMAWERAKGELNSMLQTYTNDREKFDILKKTVESFIKDVEDNGKHE
jgi:hypothetical protein